ncbi:23S rRNA (pseudouridine(1915)-N(3))-methyltransferase RlmH [Staphylococcus aureus]|nr:23S rRNA (pseudouridine(1915)-N(3))-methyltransferase RlmH [Staphylococcus aureus]
MAKIKKEKKMTLPELIQWGWDNPEQVYRAFKIMRGEAYHK